MAPRSPMAVWLALQFAATALAQGQISWVERHPVASPGLRAAHCALHEASRGKVIVFGGERNFVQLDDLWEWDGATWQKLSPPLLPPPRSWFAACSLWPKSGALLHGGFERHVGHRSGTWLWNGGVWSQVATTGPSNRYVHAMSYDLVRDRVVLFSGAGAPADTWEWDGVVWTLHTPLRSPSPRSGHAMAYDHPSQRTLLFGGEFGDETWEWDGTSWTMLNPATRPSPRSYHAMCYDVPRGRIVLHGGRPGASLPPYGDAWEWDGVAKTWTALTTPGNGPAARDLHAMTFDFARGRVLMVGGYYAAPPFFFGDTWEARAFVPVASLAFVGTGCAGTNGIPQIAGIGVPKLGNASFALVLASARANAPAALLVGENPTSALIGGGCTQLVGAPWFALPTPTDAAGSATLGMPVPGYARLLGLELSTQFVIGDPLGAFVGVACLTRGALLTLGN